MNKPSFASRRVPAPQPQRGQKPTLTLAKARTLAVQFPGDPQTWLRLGRLQRDAGELEQARESAESVVRLNENLSDGWILLGQIEVLAHQHSLACSHFERAISINQDAVEAYIGLASAHHQLNQNAAALKHIEYAATLAPDSELVLAHKVRILKSNHRYEEAISLLERLIKTSRVNPYSHWIDMGNLKRALGCLVDAEACYRKAIELEPKDATAHSNLLTLLHYMPDKPPAAIAQACRDWGNLYTPADGVRRPTPSDRNPTKRLRVGIFSDGFRQHPVGAMTTSALEHLSTLGIEIYAYTTSPAIDYITRRLMAACKRWTPISSMEDQEFAKLIRDDRIDILMDLAGHNAGSRMRTMAMQPAPILVKWVGGLINTTGVSSIDYLISDSIESPPDADLLYTEKLIRMPDDYICYMPPKYVPDVGPLPALKNGYVTFGCFNNPTKINEVLLTEWAKLLHAVPRSRLYLKGGSYSSSDFCERILAILGRNGISEDRVRLEGQSIHYQLFECYNQVDIALDPWPYSGGLTTCEAMLMGVPVITLPGPTFAGRHSATHLINAGMPELVVEDWDQYRTRAIDLANSHETLSTIRSHLRDVLIQSPVCDAKKFAQHMADALRAIWQRYTDGKKPAALAFTPNGELWFEDEPSPTAVVHPDPDPQDAAASFSFLFTGKITVLDHGATLVNHPKFEALSQLNALSVVALDPAGLARNAAYQQERGWLAHYQSHIALGTGAPATLYACLASESSGTLEPCSDERLPQFLRQKNTVLTRLPISTTRLDSINGLQQLDWLLLDDAHDNLEILQGAGNLIDGMLLIQIKVGFMRGYVNQPSIDDLTQLLAPRGFRLLNLHNLHHHNYLPDIEPGNAISGSQLVGAQIIFVPDEKRLKTLNDNQRLKLAFLLHAMYSMHDFAHHVLLHNEGDIAQRYIEAQRAGLDLLAPNEMAGARNPTPLPTSPAQQDSDFPLVSSAYTGEIPSLPHMEPQGQALLAQRLSGSRIFLEYGSGGSSVMAAKTAVQRIYSVDSDQGFLRAVQAKIEKTRSAEGRYIPIYVDIGPTAAWGHPTRASFAHRWPAYVNQPWGIMQARNEAPDLILIDGRFRVASLLISLLLAPRGCVVLFDDYVDRPQYHVVETYLKPAQTAGRMAEFIVPGQRHPGLVQALLQHCTDPH